MKSTRRDENAALWIIGGLIFLSALVFLAKSRPKSWPKLRMPGPPPPKQSLKRSNNSSKHALQGPDEHDPQIDIKHDSQIGIEHDPETRHPHLHSRKPHEPDMGGHDPEPHVTQPHDPGRQPVQPIQRQSNGDQCDEETKLTTRKG